MRLIADGVVDRDGVPGLAGHLGYSVRQVQRQLHAELGAGPLALARAQRAQTARTPDRDQRAADGRRRVRRGVLQRADLQRDRAARSSRSRRPSCAAGPYEADGLRARDDLTPAGRSARRSTPDNLFGFLIATGPCQGWRWSPTVTTRRTLRLPHGHGRGRLAAEPTTLRRCPALAHRPARPGDRRSSRCRRMLDLDADPIAVGRSAQQASVLAPTASRRRRGAGPRTRSTASRVRRTRGARSAGVGSRRPGRMLASARRDVQHGAEPIAADAAGGLDASHFPTMRRLAGLDPETLPMPRSRGRALVALCAAIAAGDIPLDRSLPRSEVRRRLLEVPGVGPWTADYIRLRALGDPDVFLPTDVGVRHGRSGHRRERRCGRVPLRRAMAALALLRVDARVGTSRPPGGRHGPPHGQHPGGAHERLDHRSSHWWTTCSSSRPTGRPSPASSSPRTGRAMGVPGTTVHPVLVAARAPAR